MLILISQKMLVDRHSAPVDALERSYAEFFSGLGTVAAVPNDAANAARLVDELSPGLLVLSGGNNVDPSMFGSMANLDEVYPVRDETERILFGAAAKRGIPILGVCRGFQFINVLLGGSLTVGLENHPPAKLHEVTLDGQRFTVNSYHRQGVAPGDLAEGLEALAVSDDGFVEAYCGMVEQSRILGVQWHPERLGTDAALFDRLLAEHLPGVAG